MPVIVNGDIVDAASAQTAMIQSGADAVMIGRGAYGRPWLAGQIDQMLQGRTTAEPDRQERLDIVLTHFGEALDFYGERLGLKIFRKHLGWYIEAAPWPADAAARRDAKSRLCRLDDPSEVRSGLRSLWNDSERLAA